MKMTLLLVALAAAIAVSPSLLLTSAEEHHQGMFSASAVCEDPETGEVALEGRIEVVRGNPDDLSRDRAVIVDEAGTVYPTKGYGVTGETMVIAPDRAPITRGIELGEARYLDVEENQLAECFISELVLETRTLTEEDIEELNLDPGLVGLTVDLETSVGGIAWVVLSPQV